MEVETGIEPVCTALQAVASPLGHSTVGVDASCTLRADDGIRTRDPHLGKVMRYQLRYIRAPRSRSSPVAKHDISPLERACTNPAVVVARVCRKRVSVGAHAARGAAAFGWVSGSC